MRTAMRTELLRVVNAGLIACALLSCHCGPGQGNNNGNDNGNNNDNGGGNQNDNGTGNTVDDLPDLSADDGLGEGEGADALAPGLVLVGYDQGLSLDQLVQFADSTANVLNANLVDLIAEIHVATFAVEAGTEEDAAEIAAQLEGVDYAELDFAGRLAGHDSARRNPQALTELLPEAASVQFAQYQLFTTNALAARAVATSGSGSVTVAVLDSGIDRSHVEFNGANLFNGFNYIDRTTNISDNFPGGHGTGVVGLLAANPNSGELAGLLPGFDVTVHKVADANGFCPLDAVVLGIIGALNGNADNDLETGEIPEADVVLCPWSFSEQYRSLERALAEADRRGVVVVAAAGNNGRSGDAIDPRFPAGYSSVIGVGATDIDNEAAPFSNRHSGLDLAAPGVDLLVLIPSNRYNFVNGTSYAAAQVAAAAAWLLDLESGLTPDDVLERLNRRGNDPPSGHGFSSTAARLLNVLATLTDQDEPIEPYLITDDALVDATGVDRDTLVSNQAGSSASATVPEAFADETLFWYGYFPSDNVRFELIDGAQRHEVEVESLVPSSIDLFLEFLRGIPLGELTRLFSVMHQAMLTMPELGGERRAMEIVAIFEGVESDPRPIIYNPLQSGFNIVAYKNFGSPVWHLLEEEGDEFDPDAADIRLRGSGPRPEIDWIGASGANRIQLGSSLDPAYLVLADAAENDLSPPIRLGACVGIETPEQICGTNIELPAGQLTRIVIQAEEPGGAQTATLDLIFVP